MDAVSPPLVYAVVLNWNLRDHTAECLDSLLHSTYPRCHILVVDNASTDGSVPFLQVRFPQAEFLINEANLGYAAGINRGIRHALDKDAAYILLLNNDTIVAEAMVQSLVAVAEADDRLGIAGPAIFAYDQPHCLWYLGHREILWWPVPRPVGWPVGPEPAMVDYVSGCAMLVRRTCFEAVGLLDERYFMYYEDADFCRRARAAGYGIVAVPEARMWHKVSRSAQQDSLHIAYVRTRNRLAFYRRHPHGPSPWLTALYLAATTALRALQAVLRGQRALARALLRGWADGWHADPEHADRATGSETEG